MKVPPPELPILVSNDPDPEDYRKVEALRWAIKQPHAAVGYRLADFDRILDFGCGAGRLMHAHDLDRREGQSLWGCDVDAAWAEWCRDTIAFATIARTSLLPPLPYADASFDLVFTISVFTHLSRPLQLAWARELLRILRPARRGLRRLACRSPCARPRGRRAMRCFLLAAEHGYDTRVLEPAFGAWDECEDYRDAVRRGFILIRH